jgi:hypothetical protein
VDRARVVVELGAVLSEDLVDVERAITDEGGRAARELSRTALAESIAGPWGSREQPPAPGGPRRRPWARAFLEDLATRQRTRKAREP